jgi:glycosyltransferase involved in cell wall biosynthesis
MRICFFGTYNIEEGYPRVRVLLEGLKRTGHQVDQCRLPFLADAASKLEGAASPVRAVRLALGLLLIHLRLCWRFLRMPPPNLVLVGYPGQLDLYTARLLATLRGVPLVLDSFVSLYDTMVDDRGLVRPRSVKAHLLRLVDRSTCLLSDAVLLDTEAHIEYFVSRLNLPREKFIRALIGEDDRVFTAGGEAAGTGGRERLEVLYFGSYIPLHGLATILDAARLLRHSSRGCAIRITVCGRGQLTPGLQREYPASSLPGVRFIDQWLAYRDLVPLIAETDVCLGIFGTSGKAGRVIPLKVYAALAMGKAIVTGNTPGSRELLRHDESALLVAPGDAPALRDALLRLEADRGLVHRLGRAADSLFRTTLAPERIAGRLIEDLSRHGIPGPTNRGRER